jgi:hypothetical protein
VSENIDRWRAAGLSDSPRDRKAQITSPKRVSTASVFVACLSALRNSRHRERASAFEPHGVLCSLIELEERVTIAASAAAKIGAFGERPCHPCKLSALIRKRLRSRCLNGEAANAATVPGAPWQYWQSDGGLS